MRDQENQLAPVLVFGPITIAADNTPAAIDLQGYDAATLLIQVGIGGITFDSSNKIEFKLTHSDDNVTYSDVVQADVTDNVTVASGGIVRSLVAAHAAATLTKVGYVGGKRYLKLLADFTGTHGAGTPMCATLVKGLPALGPV